MTSLLMLCPSRTRPWAAHEAFLSFKDTRELRDAAFLAVVDNDDPNLKSYQHLEVPIEFEEPRGGMVAQLNAVAMRYAEVFDYIGFMGDDHRLRTPGWDVAFTNALEANGGGLAYGNDLFWPKGEIPTQIVMSTSIIRALGWMALPSCQHLYVDNVWRDLGDGADALFYFPRYIIEHLHPAAGKASWDEQYLRLNSDERYAADRKAYEVWVETQAAEDIARVRTSLTRHLESGGDHGGRGPGLPE